MASLSCARTLTPANANQMYSFDTFQLANFDRASSVAQSYQRFRMTGIKLTFKPVLDTYAISAGGVIYGKANLYYIIDKLGSIPDNVTLEALKQAGARCIALDEKPIHIRWRPSVLEENQATSGGPSFSGPSGYKTSPWLSTNQQNSNSGSWAANNTNHLGIKFYIEQAGNGGAQVATPFPMDATCEFQFIKPVWGSLAQQPALGLTYATIDASPDGVEGGSDGITLPLAK